ncbi:MAG: AraC family ligand binding domain-containing protein, partial [Deltaproteobacteria bacterium]|nr:AraC family ligand binding domain-containing protein [Deltaproteobacteria bacterium]
RNARSITLTDEGRRFYEEVAPHLDSIGEAVGRAAGSKAEVSGRLRINGRKIALKPGTICHIPRGTPHDFAAGKKGEMILFYSLIKTR